MANTHDQHESFIKTPQQLVTVVLLAFLVPIIGIILVVQLVLSRPSADPQALAPEAVSARLQPVARLEIGAPAAAPGARAAADIVKTTCAACHQTGAANAPKLGDAAAWAPRIKTGINTLVQSVIKGKGAMPPKAGDPSLTESEIHNAVVLMANQAGAKFKEKPAAAPAKQQAAAPAQQAAAPTQQAAPTPQKADGKAVYDKVCFACHQVSVANSPKLGDKAAWAPRIQTGLDSLMQSVIKGKGAMPPKAGNPALTDAEIRAAVEFMVSQSK
ncbi:MAG TPA: c-type cytochrome [Burkholderiales bacterium]|nr:c-type cytochrome [Burkholderiales bacterium]